MVCIGCGAPRRKRRTISGIAKTLHWVPLWGAVVIAAAAFSTPKPLPTMKRPLAGLCLAFFAASTLLAQNATPEELAKAEAYLKQTRDALKAATSGLSEAQWTFKPEPHRWSVAEVVEHLAASEDFLRNLVVEQVMKAPGRAEAADVAEIDAFVLQAIPDRSQRVQAPEPLTPANRFASPAEALRHFENSRAATIQALKSTPNLRGHAVDSPLGKQLDAYQWLLFIGAHSERHTKQIDEVKQAAGFPTAPIAQSGQR
jgi:hypothetical protein